MVVWMRCRRDYGGWGVVALLGIALVLSAVYLGYYSKDVLVLPICLAALVLPAPRRWAFTVLVALMVTYGLLFRQYWLIITVVFILLTPIVGRARLHTLVVTLFAVVVFVSVAITVGLGVPADSFRDTVNEYRDDVGTLITPFLDIPEPFGGVLNNAITLVTLVLPWPVALKGGIYYLMISALLVGIWVLLFRGVSGPAKTEPRVRRAAALVLALLCTQAVFEPDYGSALRHLTPLLPLILYVAWRDAALRFRAREGRRLSGVRNPRYTLPISQAATRRT